MEKHQGRRAAPPLMLKGRSENLCRSYVRVCPSAQILRMSIELTRARSKPGSCCSAARMAILTSAVRPSAGTAGAAGRLGLFEFLHDLAHQHGQEDDADEAHEGGAHTHQTHKQIRNFIHWETRSSFLLVSPLYGCRFSCTRALPLSSRRLYAINFSLNARLTVPFLCHLHHIHSAVRDAEAHLKPGKRHAVNTLRIALVVRPRVLRENACEGIALVLRHAR